MGAEVFQLLGTIAVDNSDANDSLDETAGKAEKSEGRMSSAFKKIGAAIVAYMSISKIKEFGAECVSMASDVEEMQNKFDVVFQGMTDDVSDWADAYAESIGRNSNTIKGYLADNQNMFVGMGMTRDAGAALSEKMVELALDLASFNNLNETDAVNAFSKAIMGETESAKSLGAVLNENTRAMAMEQLGYEGKFESLTEAQKMEVNYQAILMQSTDAIGDCERSLDSYKGRTTQLQSAKEKLYETIGTMLLPIMTKYAENMTKMVSGIQNIVEWFQKHSEVATVLAIAIGTITTAIIAYNIAQNALAIGTAIATAATTAFGAVIAFVTSPINLVVLAIGALIAVIVLCVKHWDTIKETTSKVWGVIKACVVSAVDGIKEKWNTIKDALVKPIETAKEKVKSIIEKIKGFFKFDFKLPSIKLPHFAISPAGWKLSDLLKGSIPSLGIEWYAKGGVMDGITPFGVNGNNLMIGGEAGKEAIIPLEKNTTGIELIASKISENMNVFDTNVIQDKMDRMIDLLETLLGMRITLDSGVLVGELAPAMDTALGNIAIGRNRGR